MDDLDEEWQRLVEASEDLHADVSEPRGFPIGLVLWLIVVLLLVGWSVILYVQIR